MFRFLEKKRVLLRTEKKIPPCLTVQKYPKVNQVKCSTCCSIFLVFLSFHIQLFHKINLSNNQMMMTTKMMMGGSFFFFVTSTKQQCCLQQHDQNINHLKQCLMHVNGFLLHLVEKQNHLTYSNNNNSNMQVH